MCDHTNIDYHQRCRGIATSRFLGANQIAEIFFTSLEQDLGDFFFFFHVLASSQWRRFAESQVKPEPLKRSLKLQQRRWLGHKQRLTSTNESEECELVVQSDRSGFSLQ